MTPREFFACGSGIVFTFGFALIALDPIRSEPLVVLAFTTLLIGLIAIRGGLR
jgi:hypothetical protein